MEHAKQLIDFTVEELPELETEVSISGSSKQQEVAGFACCLGLGLIAVYVAL